MVRAVISFELIFITAASLLYENKFGQTSSFALPVTPTAETSMLG